MHKCNIIWFTLQFKVEYHQHQINLFTGGGNPYYRNDNNTNYPQNGYQRNWSSNDGTTTGNVGGGYNSGFKRGGGGGSRGGPRNDRGNMSGGSRGQYRGGQRGANQRNFAPRGKLQAQN